MPYKKRLLRQLTIVGWCISLISIAVYFFHLVPDSFEGWKDYFTYHIFFILLFLTAERRLLPWITNRLYKGWWVCVYPFLLQFLVVFVLVFLFSWMVGGIQWKDWQWDVNNLWHLALPLLLPNSLAILLFVGHRGLLSWQNSEGYRVQLLNQELIPHMLNANLTKLHPLIILNQTRAVRFVKLNNRMFHYYLKHRKVLTIPVSEELGQVKNRLEMQEISKQKPVFLRMEVDHGVLNRLIPTMLLVNLLENCFSYGILFDPQKPIKLRIEPVDDNRICIQICNSIDAVKKKSVIGTGTSLSRTEELLRYLDPHSIMKIDRSEQEFVVSIIYCISI